MAVPVPPLLVPGNWGPHPTPNLLNVGLTTETQPMALVPNDGPVSIPVPGPDPSPTQDELRSRLRDADHRIHALGSDAHVALDLQAAEHARQVEYHKQVSLAEQQRLLLEAQGVAAKAVAQASWSPLKGPKRPMTISKPNCRLLKASSFKWSCGLKRVSWGPRPRR